MRQTLRLNSQHVAGKRITLLHKFTGITTNYAPVFAHNHHISDEYSSVEAMQIGEKNNV
jgi:hypothetical protein